MVDRIDIINESDRRWPEYHDRLGYNLSGGFLDGGEHVRKNPDDDREPADIAEELWPKGSGNGDVIDEYIIGKRREGAEAGILWTRQQVTNKKNA